MHMLISQLNTIKKAPRFLSELKKATTRFELVIEVLQTFALPLGYVALHIIYFIILCEFTHPQNFIQIFFY